MRKSGAAKAAKRAGRVAAEGVVAVAHNADMTVATLIEINSETDFVARDESFNAFVKAVSNSALAGNVSDVTALMSEKMVNNESVTCEQAREKLVATVGENVQVRRVITLTSEAGVVGTYLHGGRIGVLVALDKKNGELARDIAMHIAATNPVSIDANDLPKVFLEKEREIITAQAETSGKPANIIEKMVAGRLDKLVKEVCLLGQSFVKNPDETVGDLLHSADASVLAFVRFEVGEGIEKQTVNLAEEVSATLKGSE